MSSQEQKSVCTCHPVPAHPGGRTCSYHCPGALRTPSRPSTIIPLPTALVEKPTGFPALHSSNQNPLMNRVTWIRSPIRTSRPGRGKWALKYWGSTLALRTEGSISSVWFRVRYNLILGNCSHQMWSLFWHGELWGLFLHEPPETLLDSPNRFHATSESLLGLSPAGVPTSSVLLSTMLGALRSSWGSPLWTL